MPQQPYFKYRGTMQNFKENESQLAASSNPSETLRNDYYNTRQPNLIAWSKLRMKLNERIVDFSKGGSTRSADRVDRPDDNDITQQTRWINDDLMSYSGSPGSSSSLNTTNFINYGIPRAKITPNPRLQARKTHSLMEFGTDPSEFGRLSDCECASDSDFEYPAYTPKSIMKAPKKKSKKKKTKTTKKGGMKSNAKSESSLSTAGRTSVVKFQLLPSTTNCNVTL
ncbi:hypothetical protein CAPTEDRAFT_208136 [Capitella teleta]|uniref:Uncharacterized protein n=1 Tax=Capitella teleta TaxID=283909 RepID=R7UYC6_CAPTE|nr:hypothetical protein CAPTEDRAFT_208136 [Capitella teleta]|eukprot:ELU11314.1 hypothetical protein CAPTEDRAFT_208136 [Capitella teleta]